MSTPSFQNSIVLQAGNGLNKNKWMCRVCKDNIWRDIRSALRHESAQSHQQNVQHFLAVRDESTSVPASSATYVPTDVQGPLMEVLHDLQNPQYIHSPPPPEAPQMELDYDMIAPNLEDLPTVIDPVAGLALTLQDWLQNGPETAPSDESSDDEDFQFAHSRNAHEDDDLLFGTHRTRTTHANREAGADPNWYPWTEKATCILDILQHLPHAIFSDEQMRVILWGMEVFGINGLPSVEVMKDIDRLLQSYCGVDTIQYKGVFGHVYYVNDLGKLIVQEMANPRVRKHIHHFPEDSGEYLEQCWQAQHWLRDIDPMLATPMVHVGPMLGTKIAMFLNLQNYMMELLSFLSSGLHKRFVAKMSTLRRLGIHVPLLATMASVII
ncbi:hypothetical protein L208DRAFT_1551527 [Tricholoma matsutake]|nr:hypothetical protein L208DRAFT_1551527 [Tricholoma matsutake 945]